MKYTAAALLFLPWALQASCEPLQSGCFANPETSSLYLLLVTYPWSHRTLLKLLFPGLLTYCFCANAVGK